MAQQQQQILTQRIFLSGPQQWDSWLTAVKTQALGKEMWEFVNPDGKGPSEAATPPEITLESFMAKYGIPRPSNATAEASNASTAATQGNRQPSHLTRQRLHYLLQRCLSHRSMSIRKRTGDGVRKSKRWKDNARTWQS
jgi:hypothetical protein